MLLAYLPGIVAMLIWLWMSGADRTASRLLAKSTVYGIILLPFMVILFLIFSGESWCFYVVIGPVVEEIFKAHASYSEKRRINAFSIVSIFGVWELLLVKSHYISIDINNLVEYFKEIFITFPALCFHILTGAIYAFRFRGKVVTQMIICFSLHAIFNAMSLLMSNLLILLSLIPLGALTLFILPRRRSIAA